MKYFYLFICIIITALSACNPPNETIVEKSAGLNGGFEVSQSGIPVNWTMYTPKTVPEADFHILLDSQVFKEGKQSLKFQVSACSSKGGNRSPGFTNEFIETGKFIGDSKYKISFWARNNDTKFRFEGGGVNGTKGDMKTLVESDESFNEWKYFEYEVDVTRDKWLRIELNILQPGEFWIDDLSIKKL